MLSDPLLITKRSFISLSQVWLSPTTYSKAKANNRIAKASLFAAFPAPNTRSHLLMRYSDRIVLLGLPFAISLWSHQVSQKRILAFTYQLLLFPTIHTWTSRSLARTWSQSMKAINIIRTDQGPNLPSRRLPHFFQRKQTLWASVFWRKHEVTSTV